MRDVDITPRAGVVREGALSRALGGPVLRAGVHPGRVCRLSIGDDRIISILTHTTEGGEERLHFDNKALVPPAAVAETVGSVADGGQLV